MAPYGFFKSEKMQISPQKLPMDISEKNETKVMHCITFNASSSVNRKSITSVAMTCDVQNLRKFILNPIYFAKEFGDLVISFYIKTLLHFSVMDRQF